MAQIAYFQQNHQARILTGKIESVTSGFYQMVIDHKMRNAELAASCLLKPEIGDTVLVTLLDNGQAVILSVLFRDDSQKARLTLPDQSTIECKNELTIQSAASLSLQSGNNLQMDAVDLAVNSCNATANFVNLNTITDKAEVCCRLLTTLGQSAISAFKTFTQCVGQSHKMIAENEETHCKNSTLVAEENATVMGENTLTIAKDTSRTDAKLIQLG